MKAIIVSVDYNDLLQITLPYNRHHFESVLIVTSNADLDACTIAEMNDADVYSTDSFYDDGAVFNKYKALEEGLDHMGRNGWIVQLDADVLWPKVLPPFNLLQVGNLYGPVCRIMSDLSQPIPLDDETAWQQYPARPNQVEWAGYTQIYHADDPHLGDPPWHQVDWRHAGGGDSFFQLKWPRQCKLRPPGFEALHLGPHGTNWCGRATAYLDGTIPDGRDENLKQLRQFLTARRQTRRYDSERL